MLHFKNGLLGLAGFGAGLAAYSLIRRGEEMDLANKVVLITGASRGLGLQMAREFGAEGAQVVITARDAGELARAKQDLESRGVQVHTITSDVQDREQATSAVQETLELFGRIHVLVNNAGVIRVGPIEEMTVQDFEDAMGVMFWGTLYTTLATLPSMRAAGPLGAAQCRIVNITSIGGKVSIPHLIPYSCAKFATVALSEGLRTELAPHGIRVVTIVPGLMRTGSHLNAEFKGDQEREYAWFSLGAATPLISISAERAARSIVRSTKRGEAEKILSLPAELLARLHGALPEFTAPLLSFVNRRFLPAALPGQTGVTTGASAKRQLDSRLLDTANVLGDQAAGRLNELPAR